MALLLSAAVLVANWFIYQKMGRQGWEGIIPFYNTYVLFEVLYGNGMKMFLLLIPLYNIYIGIKLLFDFVHAFGKSTGFGFGMLFLSPIFTLIMAFDKSIQFCGSHAGYVTKPATRVSVQSSTPVSGKLNVKYIVAGAAFLIIAGYNLFTGFKTLKTNVSWGYYTLAYALLEFAITTLAIVIGNLFIGLSALKRDAKYAFSGALVLIIGIVIRFLLDRGGNIITFISLLAYCLIMIASKNQQKGKTFCYCASALRAIVFLYVIIRGTNFVSGIINFMAFAALFLMADIFTGDTVVSQAQKQNPAGKSNVIYKQSSVHNVAVAPKKYTQYRDGASGAVRSNNESGWNR